jgi:hypothetical protein
MINSKKENNLKGVLWVARILSTQIAIGILAFVFLPGILSHISHSIPWLAFTPSNIVVYGVFVIFVIIAWLFTRLGGILITGWGLGIIIFFLSGKMWLMFFIFGLPCLLCGILFLLSWNIAGKRTVEPEEALDDDQQV